MKIELIKGFNDYVGEDALKRAETKKIIVDTFERYGFEPVETPIVEYEEFVRGDKSQEGDEAISDIFTLKDKGNRKLALRYEFTFQLKRIMQNKKLPFKRYQIGEVFRDEPVSGNRFRQFVQCDCDVIGSSIEDEAEILKISSEISEKLKIDFVIEINSRRLLNEILKTEGVLPRDIKNVIRELDKIGKIPEKDIKESLKKYGAEKIINIFKKPEKYFEKYESYDEIKKLKNYAKNYGIDKKIKFSPSLARGLGYYNGIVFELKTKKMSKKSKISSASQSKMTDMQESFGGGGSYEFNGIQCTGIAFGLGRISNLGKIDTKKEKYLVVSLDKDKESIKLAEKLRNKNKIASIFYGKPSKSLEYANSYKYNKVIFVGEKEIKAKKFKVKDMNSGKESILKI